MAFSFTSFETPYGFTLLDELHNFFPELLYDELLFQDLLPRYIRVRTHELFPAAFTRQQNMYRLYLASNRRTRAVQWLQPAPVVSPQTNVVSTGAPAPTHAPVPEPTPATPSTPVRTQRPRVTPNAPVRPTRANDVLSEFVSALMSMPLSNEIPSLQGLNINQNTGPIWTYMGGTFDLGNLWSDVEVRPSAEQIDAGSELVNQTAIPADVTCAICLDRGERSQWRRLHCSHYFHCDCISRWFAQNVVCPVCRADIRDVQHNDEEEE
jgi:hypothetical protein